MSEPEVGTLTAATEAILSITGALRPAMREFMDTVAVKPGGGRIRKGEDRAAPPRRGRPTHPPR
ncbi:hypothetical protein, partial [Nocardia cyriacigeorgica]|uniref:hypothetical protein n=1 Tax=Nocardia cyriacigeorgica TaxID=135487 RepID=UPI002456570B